MKDKSAKILFPHLWVHNWRLYTTLGLTSKWTQTPIETSKLLYFHGSFSSREICACTTPCSPIYSVSTLMPYSEHSHSYRNECLIISALGMYKSKLYLDPTQVKHCNTNPSLLLLIFLYKRSLRLQASGYPTKPGPSQYKRRKNSLPVTTMHPAAWSHIFSRYPLWGKRR